MKRLDFERAYYIKLGKKGKWEKSSIKDRKLRIGWGRQDLDDINQARWSKIDKQLLREKKGNRTVATRDLHALQMICQSTPADIWVTFHDSRLWWCRVARGKIHGDRVSKYRRVQGKWHCRDTHGEVLAQDRIPGRLVKTQGFRATACVIHEVDALRRLLNNEQSQEARNVEDSREALAKAVSACFIQLHWKDFETLVDLVFRSSGWQRISMVGESQKFTDIDLRDPITDKRYRVQIKATAGLADLRRYARQFKRGIFETLYFVVHNPHPRLREAEKPGGNVELWLPERLAQMVVDAGLVRWLLNKVR